MPFSPQDTATLSAVLDEIIPPSEDGRMPGAGEVGLAAYIEEVIGRSPELGPAVEQGLSALDAAAREAGGAFAELDAATREAVLNGIAGEQPAFLPGLAFQTFTGYYQQPRVLEGLGLEGRPPHPKGFPLEEGDLGLLDPVRERGQRYREA